MAFITGRHAGVCVVVRPELNWESQEPIYERHSRNCVSECSKYTKPVSMIDMTHNPRITRSNLTFKIPNEPYCVVADVLS